MAKNCFLLFIIYTFRKSKNILYVLHVRVNLEIGFSPLDYLHMKVCLDFENMWELSPNYADNTLHKKKHLADSDNYELKFPTTRKLSSFDKRN